MSEDTSDPLAQGRNAVAPEETRSMETQNSMIVSPNHGSITYPYRTLMKDSSFARYHLMPKPCSNPEAFGGSLSMLGHGHPLWEPIGNLARPREQLNSGISIGDVGFLTAEGNFHCFFNIFLPPDSPAQFYCPEDLEPLEPLLDSEISTNSVQFPPGTALVSNGIESSILSTSPLNIQFTVKTREGGILVLPDGALREDLLSTARIQDYVKEHALNWYTFFRERLGGAVVHPNGALYVVTGTDKADAWANCVTSARPTRIRRLWKPPTIIYRGVTDSSPHRWECDHDSKDAFAYQRSRPIEHVGKCALFIRGMRIAVNIRDWTEHILQNRPPIEIHYSVIRKAPGLGFWGNFQTFKECLPGYSQKAPADVGPSIRIMFHPLDVILKLLLKEAPSSKIALLEDNVWCAVADKSDATLASIVRLFIQILETHETFTEDGVITLVPRPNSQEKAPSTSSPKFWLQPAGYFQHKYHIMRRSRDISNRLAKVFPRPALAGKYLRRKYNK